MGKIYYLDLKTLIETLAGQSGVLKREIPQGVANLKEPLRCTIYIERGQIMRCMLTGNSGQLFDGRDLLPIFYKLENWDVTFNTTPKKPPQSQSQGVSLSSVSPSSEDLLIPYQIAQMSAALFNTLPRKDRMLVQMVLIQIDGSRSIAEIKAQVTLPVDAVERATTILFQSGIVRIRKRDKP